MKRLDSYSQHFLRNPDLVKELIGHTSIKPSDTVYDIGAGSGVITSVLAKRCREVIAIEPEPRAAAKLRENMANNKNVTIFELDFLAFTLPDTPYKIFANIPFHISSAILHKITEAKNPPTDAYLIVQKQFARKLLPEYDGFSGQLGMCIGPEFAVRIRRPLRRTDFWPNPNVDTVLLEIKHRTVPLLDKLLVPDYRKFVTTCFAEQKYFAGILRMGIAPAPNIRPSQMTLMQWIDLYKAWKSKKK